MRVFRIVALLPSLSGFGASWCSHVHVIMRGDGGHVIYGHGAGHGCVACAICWCSTIRVATADWFPKFRSMFQPAWRQCTMGSASKFDFEVWAPRNAILQRENAIWNDLLIALTFYCYLWHWVSTLPMKFIGRPLGHSNATPACRFELLVLSERLDVYAGRKLGVSGQSNAEWWL